MENTANNIRKKILNDSFRAGACHISSALSCVEICLIITDLEGDFLFSKASGAATVYAIMGLGWKHLKENPLHWPGGSLGHGLPIATGMALGNRNKKVYVLMSDAELSEGTTWESIAFASHHKLDNLIIIIDRNYLQACGSCIDILNLEPLFNKFRAFGCEVRRTDGHNMDMLKSALTYPILYKGRPIVVIADTIKGRGVDFMENQYEWHYKNLTPALLKRALKQC